MVKHSSGAATAAKLPSWASEPPHHPAAIREIKTAIRRRIAASGRTVEEVFGVVADTIASRTAEMGDGSGLERTAWPVIEYADIARGAVTSEAFALLRRRGCAVIRGHFEHEQARQWDRDIVEYLESNNFADAYRGPGDDFFDSVRSNPEIYPIYWSRAQMEARQSDSMATVQSFLNSLWRSTSAGTTWFDPNRSVVYPDRIRRRPPGVTSKGLGAHHDAGTLDLWMAPHYQRAFRHVFDGSIEDFDPWDAAHRTDGGQYAGSTMTSVFRTFQGWTALSDTAHDQGTLQVVPIPEAIAFVLLRPLLSDVPDDDMCGAAIGKAFPIRKKWHAPLLGAMRGIPSVRAGDSVWWRGDMVHRVAPVTDQQGWSNVMYIPAAPWCPRNERYAASVVEAFRTGQSPPDFPTEHYEQSWPNRFPMAELNDIGRRGFGLAVKG